MNKTRKIRKGGTMELTFVKYATMMKNNQQINIAEFEAFLDSVVNPLKKLFAVEPTVKYTINEWAIICECKADIHRVFTKYEVAINRRTIYPNLLSDQPHTVLEAYILQGIYDENIRKILEQIGTNSKNIEDSLFHYNEQNVPTVFKYTLQMASTLNTNISEVIYSMIINKYMSSECFNMFHNINIIFAGAITYNKPDLLISIVSKMDNNSIISLLFNENIVELLLLQNNEGLYQAIVEILNRIDPNIITHYLYPNTPVPAEFSYKNVKKIFKELGKSAIKHLTVGDIHKRPKIIVVCHGTITGPKMDYEFSYGNLCYYVDKGKILLEACVVSRALPELICGGHYDENLKCTKSSMGTISVEQMKYSFKATSYGQNTNIGFYICKNRVISVPALSKSNKSLLQGSIDFETLISICDSICDTMDEKPGDIDIMVFACRGYEDGPEDMQLVVPTVVLSESS